MVKIMDEPKPPKTKTIEITWPGWTLHFHTQKSVSDQSSLTLIASPNSDFIKEKNFSSHKLNCTCVSLNLRTCNYVIYHMSLLNSVNSQHVWRWICYPPWFCVGLKHLLQRGHEVSMGFSWLLPYCYILCHILPCVCFDKKNMNVGETTCTWFFFPPLKLHERKVMACPLCLHRLESEA